MINKTRYGSWLQALPAGMAALAMAVSATTVNAGALLGPLNPGFESGALDWNVGGPQDSGGMVTFDNEPTNGPSAPGTNCAMMTADGTVSPPNGNDLRANYFSLGAAALGSNGVTFQFDYNIINPINSANSVRCDLRFEDVNGNFLGEHLFYIGTPNGDAGGQGWQHFSGAATPIPTAVTCDIRISMNIFGDDIWSNGPVLFDNFSVTVNSGIGPQNPGFEMGALDWNVGGPQDSGGMVTLDNEPTNGPSAPGTNCAMMTADGSVSPPNGNDLRANYFPLGAATQGTNAISIDFDYNILNTINFGNEVRVGCRFEDSGGGFLGEYNFHIGTPNNDTGGQGWLHFHGVAVPVFTAVNMDIRISMNIFGDDIWSSGPVLFDNFVIKVTPLIGPNYNPGFENAGANWNTGGPGGPAGSVSFANEPSNGPSALGTNCALITSDGSDGPTGNGVDLRVNEYNLANGGQPVTFSWDYNILNTVNPGDEIRVGLRFFDTNNNFVGENNTHLGTPNGDVGGQGWKHMSISTVPPSAAVSSDIRVSMNIFGTGDDNWTSGPILFDNFTVATGVIAPPTVNNITIGTIKGRPVTWLLIGASQPATDSGGNPLTVSFVSTATNGTTSTDGSSVTYDPAAGYIGNDLFTFGISDGVGGYVTGTASVVVDPTVGLNQFTNTVSAAGTNLALTFSGAAYCDYILQSTPSLSLPRVWTPQATNAANASGVVTFTVQQSGTDGFWRAVLMP